MRKVYLFIAGMLVAAYPAFSQQRPAATENDPSVIFLQNFEPEDPTVHADSAYKAWEKIIVDSISELYYYNKTGNSSVSGANVFDGSADWQIAGIRTDSVILLRNGVAAVSGAINESYGILADGASVDRAQAFEKYGEDGGDYYFRYFAGDGSGIGEYSSSSGTVPAYRRNLFVRGLNIEENSSYRLTLFMKATQMGKFSSKFIADIMRGYSNSEKPFTMSGTSGEFTYTKTDFNGEWEKITFMTYYLTDSVADTYFYQNGYWWATRWTWKPEGSDREYNYIKQPDNFFIRLSFNSDSTEFLMDNLSLTKSWIGGVEHWDNMMRVDFGYETDLKDQAKAALAETGIAAVELPGEYFSVYGYYAKGSNKGWYPIAIASAEYHDDGYMYMWSKDAAKGVKNPFSNYDSVLVSFTNPVDNKALRLSYNGKTYPCALDEDWVADGKPVKNFTNELSRLNPNITKDKYGKPVYSMKQLPPVVTSAPFENGSFGLTSFNEITVGMSREIVYDNTGETSELAYLRVTKSGFKEIWKVKAVTDSTATFERSAADIAAHGELSGTLLFEFVNLKGEATDYRKPNPTYNYEFGVIDTNPNPNPAPIMQTNFGSVYQEQCVPLGYIIWDGYTTKFSKGKGYITGTKSRLYPTVPSESNGNANTCFYLSARGSANGGHLYYGYGIDDTDTLKLKLEAGSYNLNFRAGNWSGYQIPVTIYVYPLSATSNPQENPIDESDKIKLGTFIPTVTVSSSNIQSSTPENRTWDNEPFSFSFTISKADYYVIEWVSACGEGSSSAISYAGLVMTDFNITKGLGLSYSYVLKLNQTIAEAEAKLESAAAAKYQGTDYDAFDTVIKTYKTWQNTAPSEYDKATATVKNATAAMQLRMDTVDLYYTTEVKAIDKLAEFDDDTLGYKGLDAFKALEAIVDANASYDCSTKKSSEITAAIKAYNDAMTALDVRLALIDKFNAKLAETDALIKADNAHKEYDEYPAMVQAYDKAQAYDQIAPSDSAFTLAYNELVEGKNGYVFKVDYVAAKTRQIKELFALADTLGYDFGGKKADVKATVDALLDDDAALNNVLREAAILQILKVYASDDAAKKEELNGLDVSALIPNYFLYTEAEAGRDMEKNSSGNWRLKSGENKTAFPGWTFSRSGGNWIPTDVKVGAGDGYMDWEVDGHVFIAGLRCKSTSQAKFGTDIIGLPHGFYWFGLYGYNQTSGVNITLNETSGKLNDWNGGSKFNYKEVGADSVLVTDKLSFQFNQTSSSSSEFDIRYFILRLEGADTATYDYSADVAAQEAKLADAITFVAAPVQEVGEQLFNLGGVRIDAAKPGQIVIRRKALVNGKSAVEKVLVK